MQLESDNETEYDYLLVEKEGWLDSRKLKAFEKNQIIHSNSNDTLAVKYEEDYFKNPTKLIGEGRSENNKENFPIKNLKKRKRSFHKLNEFEQKSKKNIVRAPLDSSDKIPRPKKPIQDADTTDDTSLTLNKSLNKSSKFKRKNIKNKINSDKCVTESEQIKPESSRNTSLNISKTIIGGTCMAKDEKLQDKQLKTMSDKGKKSLKNKQRRLSISKDENSTPSVSSSSNKSKDDLLNFKNNDNVNRKIWETRMKNVSSSKCNQSYSDSETYTSDIPLLFYVNNSDEDFRSSNDNDNNNEDFDINVSEIMSEISSLNISKDNLDDTNIAKFFNDDVTGDECQTSKSESSDPDDNGSYLADFVVNDDEVEDADENKIETEKDDQDKAEDEHEDLREVDDGKKSSDRNGQENDKVEDVNNEKHDVPEEVDGNETTTEQVKDTTITNKTIEVCQSDKDVKETSLNLSSLQNQNKETQNTRVEMNLPEENERIKVFDDRSDDSTFQPNSVENKQQERKRKLSNAPNVTEQSSQKQVNEYEILSTPKIKKRNTLSCSPSKTDSYKNEKIKITLDLSALTMTMIDTLIKNKIPKIICSDEQIEDISSKGASTILEGYAHAPFSKDLSTDELELAQITEFSKPMSPKLCKSITLDTTESTSKCAPVLRSEDENNTSRKDEVEDVIPIFENKSATNTQSDSELCKPVKYKKCVKVDNSTKQRTKKNKEYKKLTEKVKNMKKRLKQIRSDYNKEKKVLENILTTIEKKMLEALEQITDNIQARRNISEKKYSKKMLKKERKKQLQEVEQKPQIKIKTNKRDLKRRSGQVIENLSDSDFSTKNDSVSLSSHGSTTQFKVSNLRKFKKN